MSAMHTGLHDIPPSPSRSAYLSLVEAHEALVDDFRDLFRQHGLTPTQFNVLRILIRRAPEGVSCGEIAAELLHRVPDVTRLLDRMVRDGLVQRGRSRSDRRVVLNTLTEEGRQRCVALYEPIAEVHAQQFAGIPDEELQRVTDLLQKVVAIRGAKSAEA
jgi:DNA-binding MarR family transcriptional regulator